MESFYEELEFVFDKVYNYHMIILMVKRGCRGVKKVQR
jgi:hypothetical protein